MRTVGAKKGVGRYVDCGYVSEGNERSQRFAENIPTASGSVLPPHRSSIANNIAHESRAHPIAEIRHLALTVGF